MTRRRWAVLLAGLLAAILTLSGAPLAYAQTEADIAQDGDNDGDSDQSGELRSGDGAAGSQITGIVAEPGSTTRVRKSNTSEDGEATSGNVDSASTTSVLSGPRVEPPAGGCPILFPTPEGSGPPTAACVVQDGDNEASASGSSAGTSGDALASSQVTGIVNGGDTVAVDLESIGEDAEATSGDVALAAEADVLAGPVVTEAIEVNGDAVTTASVGSIDGPTDAFIVQDGDNETDAAQTVSGSTGDALAGAQVAGVVASDTADVSITASNASEDAEATTGDATSVADVTADAGPLLVSGEASTVFNCPAPGDSAAADTLACIAQDGDNSVETDQASDAASGDAVGGAQVAGVVASDGADVTIDLDDVSEDADAVSGEATAVAASSGDTVRAGPHVCGTANEKECFDYYGSEGGAAVASIEDTVANIVQEGDNDATLAQDASGATGDAVAGGQVVGVVSEGGTMSVAGTQDTEDAEATSGDATATALVDELRAEDRTAVFELEIASITNSGGDVVHEGDNEADLTQDAAAASGDAIGGGQVVGLVGTGDADLVLDNTAEDPEATSGDATADATAGVVFAGDGSAVAIEIGADSITTAAGDIVHEGDNELAAEQVAGSTTGDAVAGSQILAGVTAGVILLGGSVSIDATNASEDDEATTGDATSGAALDEAVAGNLAADQGLTIASISDAAGTIVHDGDNELDITEDASSATGDAVAGGQVLGAVGAGTISIVADNTSEDGEATSGDGDATTSVSAALSGNSVSGSAGIASLEEIDLDANGIARDGDDELTIDLTAAAAGGDAVAGGQVAGVVSGAGGSAALDLTNGAEDAEATSGDAAADATVGAVVAGDLSTRNGVNIGPGSIDDVTGGAIVHEGDDELDIASEASAVTGDAVGGGQIVGSIGPGDVDIVLGQTSEDAEATTGDADASTFVDAALTGDLFVGGGRFPLPGSIDDVDFIDRGIVHDGDNETSIGQTAGATSGDAVAGGQVAGVVTTATGSVAIDGTNASEDDEATSGDAAADAVHFNAITGDIVVDQPQLLLSISDVTGPAGIVHDGDNETDARQTAGATTGDAVGGGQVFGAVGSGDTTIVASNTSEDGEATTGDATAFAGTRVSHAGDELSEFGDVFLSSISGPIAARIVHEGDNEVDIGQSAAAATGDAVAGGQVTGAVTSGGGSFSADLTSTAEDAESTSGEADASATAELIVAGAVAAPEGAVFLPAAIDAEITGAVIVHDGDNEATVDQALDVGSGDAVAGGQVTGAVVEGGSGTVVADNTSEDDETTTGDGLGNAALTRLIIGPIVADAIIVGSPTPP